jgi:hypothetical protein
MIFSFLFPAFDEAKYLKWLYATRVCHQWREAALSYPYLWSVAQIEALRVSSKKEGPRWTRAMAETAFRRSENE